jgi:hypothetical protein
LIVDDLFEELPTSQKILLLKKQIAMNNPLFKDLIFDENGTITTIIIDTATYTSLDKNGNPLPQIEEEDEFDSEEGSQNQNIKKEFLSDWENAQIVQKVNEIVKRYESPDFEILVSGTAVINAELKSSMTKDMQKFIKLVVLAVIILLSIFFQDGNQPPVPPQGMVTLSEYPRAWLLPSAANDRVTIFHPAEVGFFKSVIF